MRFRGQITVFEVEDMGLVFQGGVRLKTDTEAVHRLNFLKAVDVHPLALKLGNLFRLQTRVFKTFGGNEKIHMAFIQTVTDLGIIKSTMH